MSAEESGGGASAMASGLSVRPATERDIEAIVGTFMLTFTPVLYRYGAHRVILEGVRVAPEMPRCDVRAIASDQNDDSRRANKKPRTRRGLKGL